ncbi:MAG: hypothetical protein R6T91_01410 [Bacteroidales bacterium]
MNKILMSAALCLLLSFLLTGCISYKPQNAKKVRGKLYEEFFAGDEGMQYFIKPLKFEGQESDYIVFADFTFRVREEIRAEDSVVLNFSLLSKSSVAVIDSIALKTSRSISVIRELDLLFKEKKDQEYTNRYSSRTCLMSLHTFFKAEHPAFIVYIDNKQFTFVPDKRSSQNMHQLEEDIFQLYGSTENN